MGERALIVPDKCSLLIGHGWAHVPPQTQCTTTSAAQEKKSRHKKRGIREGSRKEEKTRKRKKEKEKKKIDSTKVIGQIESTASKHGPGSFWPWWVGGWGSPG